MQVKRKLRLKSNVKDIIGIISLFAILLIGIVLLNARMAQINKQQKSAIVCDIQMAHQ